MEKQTSSALETILNLKRNLILILGFGLMTTVMSGQKLPDVRVNQEEVTIEDKFIEANRERLLGNYDKAEAKILALIKDEKDNAVLHYELAKLYSEIGELEKAQSSIESAIQYDAGNEWYWHFSAENSIERDNYPDIMDAYSELSKMHPERHEYLENIAFHQLRNEDPNGALKTLNKVEKIAGINFETTRQKHLILHEMGQTEKASNELDQYIEKHPTDTRMMQIAGSYAFNENQNEKAKKYFQKIIEIEPNNSQAKSALVSLASDSNSDTNKLAMYMADEKVTLDDKIIVLIPVLSDMQIGKSQYTATQVMEWSALLLKQYGENAKIYALRGDVLSLDENIPESIKEYKKSLEINDSKYLVWESLLYLLTEEQNQKDLKFYAEDAMDLFPNKPMPHAFYAYYLALRNDFKGVEKSLNQAYIITGNNNDLMAQVKNMEMQISKLQGQ